MRTAAIPTIVACLFAALLPAPIPAADAAAETAADAILAATGVRGGLVVHLGCGDGTLSAALGRERLLVHGLATDSAAVDAARKTIADHATSYGPVSIDLLSGNRLPYVDELVNLIIAEEPLPVSRAEIDRALAPGGVAYIKGASGWTTSTKPWPKDIDDWSHYLHDASNNAVGNDTRVGPPRHMHWLSDPPYCRSHEFNSSISACVTAEGRMFYIIDEGIIGLPDLRLPSRWALVGRDAFSGVFLWKHPMPKWGYREWNTRGLWSTPLTLPRRLVTDGTRVFATLGYDSPISVIDAPTGKILRTLDGSAGTDEMILSDGVLLAATREELMIASEAETQAPAAPAKGKAKQAQKQKKLNPHELTVSKPGPAALIAFDAASGRRLWGRPAEPINILTPAAHRGKVCFHNESAIICLDLKTGRELWTADCPPHAKTRRHSRGTLVMQGDVVLFTAAEGVAAFSAESGKSLWKGPVADGYSGSHPPDLYVANDVVWYSEGIEGKTETAIARSGRDLRTGDVAKTVQVSNLISPLHHYRCYRGKATVRFMMLGKRGIEFLDLQGNDHMRHDWLRAPCSYGFVPANGLLYMPPSQCFCYPGVKLSGFNALAATRTDPGKPAPSASRVEKGPAFQQIGHRPSSINNPDDWPMHRRDPARSGGGHIKVPTQLEQAWKIQLGGKLTPSIVAAGRLYVASADRHEVHAIDETSGKSLWSFTAGGRIDSPPTFWHGMLFFGCADGRVYCLDAQSGALAWRFQAAPHDLRIVAREQLESVWPVHGSVLVLEDKKRGADQATVYCTAGRSTFLDGGIYIRGLDARTGRSLYETRFQSERPNVETEEGRPFDMDGSRSDILVSDGEYLFLYLNVFDRTLKRIEAPRITDLGDRRMPPHLMTTAGFLDDSWWDRTYWTYGSRWPGFYFANDAPGAGQIMVFDDKYTYGLHVFTKRLRLSPGFTPGADGYELFANDKTNELHLTEQSAGREKGPGFTLKDPPKWTASIPVRARAMVLVDSDSDATDGGRTLFLAGPPDVLDEKDPYASFDGKLGAKLWAVSTGDGERLAEYHLESPPAFDGMAAANGKLFIVGQDGTITCMK